MLLLHQDVLRADKVGHITVLDVVIRACQVVRFLETNIYEIRTFSAFVNPKEIVHNKDKRLELI
jgi:hypothetical protein